MSGVAVGLPVMVTFSETVGCVGRVDGKSMRVRFPLIVSQARPYFFPSTDRFQYAARGKEGLET